MTYEYLNFSTTDGIARIELNRPDQGNAFDIALAREFETAVRECSIDNAVRVVVLTGNGKLFCGGGDLAYFSASGDSVGRDIKELADSLHCAYSTLMRMPKPLIVALNGTAAGIGLSLALLGDITLSVESAKFVAAYTDVGLSPDGGLTYFLPRIIGVKRASEFILTSGRVGAQQALEWGMVNEVVPSNEELESRTQTLAQKLSQASPGSLASAKSLLLSSQSLSLEALLHEEAIHLSNNASSENGKEGINAFLERRKPVFK